MRSTRRSLAEYGRGVVGGLLFSLPLLFTMEVWWTGFTATPEELLAGGTVTLLLLIGYNRHQGIHAECGWFAAFIESIEELGLGVVTASFFLWLIGRLHFEVSFAEVIGQVALASMVAAVGVSVGTAQLGGREQEDQERVEYAEQLILAVCGAFLVAMTVAPTEEIVHIGAEAGPERLLGMLALSAALVTVVLYFSEFRGSGRSVRREGGVDMAMGVVESLAVAIVVAGALLLFFGRLADVSFATGVAQVTVLTIPAALGASAGRMLLQ